MSRGRTERFWWGKVSAGGRDLAPEPVDGLTDASNTQSMTVPAERVHPRHCFTVLWCVRVSCGRGYSR